MCFVVIMPIFFFPLVLFQFLRGGGEKLVDELSLARQGRVGDNIVTRGHDLNTKCECIDCYIRTRWKFSLWVYLVQLHV